MIPNTTLLDPGSVPKIYALTKESERLAQSVDRWNNLYVFAGAVALVLAVVVFIAQWKIISDGRKLSAAQAELIAAKDRELKAALSQHEADIADTNKKVAEANREAAHATEKAANLEVEAASLRLELTRQGARATLLKKRETTFIQALKPFAGQKVEVRFSQFSISNGVPTDGDTRTLALGLQIVLETAGWRVSPAWLGDEGGKGILVEVRSDASPQTRQAARALISALQDIPLEVALGGTLKVSDRPRIPQGRVVDRGVEREMPPMDSETIVVQVLDHP